MDVCSLEHTVFLFSFYSGECRRTPTIFMWMRMNEWTYPLFANTHTQRLIQRYMGRQPCIVHCIPRNLAQRVAWHISNRTQTSEDLSPILSTFGNSYRSTLPLAAILVAPAAQQNSIVHKRFGYLRTTAWFALTCRNTRSRHQQAHSITAHMFDRHLFPIGLDFGVPRFTFYDFVINHDFGFTDFRQYYQCPNHIMTV